MQANQSAVIWTVVIAALVLLVAGFLAVGNINKNQPEPADVPTAAEIASLISVPAAPEAPVVDTSVQDRICELTDGCEYWEANHPNYWLNFLNNEPDAREDFVEAMEDFTGIDEDYLVVQANNAIDLKEYQIRTYEDENEGVDGSWEIKTFIKVKYYDSDEANGFNHRDAEHAYLVVTSTLDEGDYDGLAIEEVSRSFEF